MKNKYIVLIMIIGMIALTGITSMNKAQKEHMKDIEDRPLTRQSIDQNFYYNQLTSYEQEIYNHLITQLNNYSFKVLELKEPISLESLKKINFVVTNSRYKVLDYSSLLPLGKSKKLNDETMEEIEKDGIFALIPITGAINKCLFEGEDGDKEECTIEECNKLISQAITDEYIKENEQRNEALEHELASLIAGLPEKATQIEASTYFADWIKDNIKYPTNNVSQYMENHFEEFCRQQSLYCIVERKATCVGYAHLLYECLNKVGVECYIIAGKSGSVNHEWNAIKIGDEVRYIDLAGTEEKSFMDQTEIGRYNTEDGLFNYIK